MNEVLNILASNYRITNAQIATMLNMDIKEVNEIIKKYEADKVIMGYNALVNWEKAGTQMVTAFIELKVTLQRGEGFDKIVERVCRFDKVKTAWLMSGSFDIGLIVEDRTMRDIAFFVAEKLAPMDSIISTGTHFVLKTYKECGVIIENPTRDERGYVSL